MENITIIKMVRQKRTENKLPNWLVAKTGKGKLVLVHRHTDKERVTPEGSKFEGEVKKRINYYNKY